MSIEFKQTHYFNLVNQTGEEIKTKLESKTPFKYGKVGYSEFKKEYSCEGQFARKVIALPMAVWSIAVKTIVDLGRAILNSAVLLKMDRDIILKPFLFHAARNFQEGFGWIMTIFNDRLGAYHIQESSFQKSCNDYSVHVHNILKSPDVMKSEKELREVKAANKKKIEDSERETQELIARLKKESMENDRRRAKESAVFETYYKEKDEELDLSIAQSNKELKQMEQSMIDLLDKSFHNRK